MRVAVSETTGRDGWRDEARKDEQQRIGTGARPLKEWQDGKDGNSLREAAIDVVVNLGQHGQGINGDGWTLVVGDAGKGSHDGQQQTGDDDEDDALGRFAS